MTRSLLLALAASLLLPSALAAPLPAAAVFSPPQVGQAALSPDGRRVALRVLSAQGVDQLAVIELDSDKRSIIASDPGADVTQFAWVGPQRLLFRFGERRVRPLQAPNLTFGWYGVDADGNNRADLSGNYRASLEKALPSSALPLLRATALDGQRFWALQTMSDRDGRPSYANLLQTEVASGRYRAYAHNLGQVRQWLIDAKGEPRLAVSRADGQDSLQLREGASEQWRVLARWPSNQPTQAILPAFGAPDGSLYVTATRGGDKRALYRLDPASGQLAAEATVELSDYDFSGEPIFYQGRLAGLRYSAAAPDTAWFLPELRGLQERVDGLLRSTTNELSLPQTGDAPYVLVRAFSGTQPEAWLIFDRVSGKLRPLGASRPALDVKSLAEPELVSIRARDGLAVPAWLHRPHGAKGKLPLVLLLTDGPFAPRQEYGFQPEAQYLASRGYAVLQPQLRGRNGLGQRHFAAGLGQLGRATLDDVLDSVRWAVAEGLAAADKICVVGQRSGGYLAVLSALQDKARPACVAELNGSLSYENTYARGLPLLLATPAGYEAFEVEQAYGPAASLPSVLASAPRAPVLSLHGIEESPLVQRNMNQLQEAGRAQQLAMDQYLYEDEGNILRNPAHLIDAWERIAAFLARHLGQP
ncbi:S9 family peptidase [Massilia sp. TS11]|uniref:alpha/beta hydrolase family protein n=1 Tax=Massilia sp. TS11 TaxID=2908003 RepID=UPI001EDB6CFD|nr:prolyl oligopeptidase family serine peptidase [Massilia sp. TS11]MCG2586457.1 prolyl oligopeptidase family serine peptidase [Massilia sp. TS11]